MLEDFLYTFIENVPSSTKLVYEFPTSSSQRLPIDTEFLTSVSPRAEESENKPFILSPFESGYFPWKNYGLLRFPYWSARNASTELGPLGIHDPPLFSPAPSIADQLLASLLEEPLEDGILHPAERTLRDALRLESESIGRWILRLLDELDERVTLGAGIIKCLGRLNAGQVPGWGEQLMSLALQHRNIEVRDAAVQALEHWASPAALRLLRAHNEPVLWLKEYVARIIKEVEASR